MPQHNCLSVSVVIPTHNRSRLLRRAIGSVLRQIDAHDEVLVVDDGSTDDTAAVVAVMQDGRLRYIRQSQRGAGVARNCGVEKARGDLVAFLDSDDEWLPGKIAVQRQWMSAHPEVLYCFTNMASEAEGERIVDNMRFWHADRRSWEVIAGNPGVLFSASCQLPASVADFLVYTGDLYRGEMHHNYIATSSLVVRRRAAADALHFAEDLPTYEDWVCFGRLARRGRGSYLDTDAYIQHRHRGPRLTDAGWLQRAEARLAVLQKVWGSDAKFLLQHGREYRALVNEQKLARVHGLLSLGRTGEARQQIRQIRGVPLHCRAMAHMPAALALGLLRMRRVALPRGRGQA